MASPEVEIDFENVGLDYSGAVVTVRYPQRDGTWRSFDYDIPETVMEKSCKEKSIEPIVEYLSEYIAKAQFEAIKRTGVDLKDETYQKYLLNQYGIIKKGLSESLIEEILRHRDYKIGQTRLEDFFGELTSEEEKIEKKKDEIHKELIDFFGENIEELANLFYTVYSQKKK